MEKEKVKNITNIKEEILFLLNEEYGITNKKNR